MLYTATVFFYKIKRVQIIVISIRFFAGAVEPLSFLYAQ